MTQLVHPPKGRRQPASSSGSLLWIWLLLLASLTSEATALYALFSLPGAPALMGFVGLHLGAAGLASESLRNSALRSNFGGTGSIAVAGAFFTLAFPALGSLVVLYLVVARPAGRRSFANQESLESQRARAAADAMERKRGEQQVGSSVYAIGDALKDRDKDVRIAAVESLRGQVSPKAVQFLEQSQLNTVFDVRVRAIENLNLLRDTFRKKLAASRQLVLEGGNAIGPLLAHADLCMETAELGIEDPSAALKLFGEAHHHASVVCYLAPQNHEAQTMAARALRALGRDLEAELTYRELLQHNRGDIEAVVGLAEVQFNRKDFGALRNTCRQIVRMQTGALSPELLPAMRIWLRDAGAPRSL